MRRLILTVAFAMSACGGGSHEAGTASQAAQSASVPPAGPHDAVVQSFRGRIGQPQGAQIFYAPQSAGAEVSDAFSKQNMLTVVGRNPHYTAGIEEAARKGAIIAPYLNAVVADSSGGPYQAMMHERSECGEPLPVWQGTRSDFGAGADVTVPHFADKLLCVVRRIKADHPYIKAIFLDDFGPGWSGYDKNKLEPDAPDSEECRARKALGDAFDKLRAANLNLLFFVNGSWNVQFCGGWPEPKFPGLRFAVPVYEHHVVGHIPSANVTYGATSQWLRDSEGQVGVFVITNNEDESDEYRKQPWAAWIAEQERYDKVGPHPVVGHAHSIGLSFGEPHGVTQAGDQWSSGQVANRVRATPVQVSRAGSVHSASVHLDGRGDHSTGTQGVRLVLYADAGGRPGAMLATGREFRVAAASLPAWYTSEFPAPVNLPAGRYWLGVWTGGTAAVSRNNGSWGSGINYHVMDAPYSATGAPPARFTAQGGGSSLLLSAFLSLQ